MSSPVELDTLLDFALDFTRDIDHYSQVRTEVLAESFRRRFDLPSFPSLDDLWKLCGELGVQLSRSPAMPPALPGLNMWQMDGSPTILLNDDLSRLRAETTLGHELREVIENAFRRVKPSYEALDTSDNRKMNPESDQFAGYLLMQAEVSRLRLRDLGFDFALFAAGTRRSLSSVILRSRQLFPAAHPEHGPVAGVWLFEAPWVTVEAGRSSFDELRVNYDAHLSGFSTRKNSRPDRLIARHAFPERGRTAAQYPLALQAVNDRRPVIGYLSGFDLFGERDFIVGAEPFFAGGSPWRLLFTAVRRDCEAQVQPWVKRLSCGTALPTFRTTLN